VYIYHHHHVVFKELGHCWPHPASVFQKSLQRSPSVFRSWGLCGS